MYIINKKPLTSNILWDKEKGCQLCKFVNGRFETNDTELAEKLRDMGYEISGEPDEEKKSDEETPEPDEEKKSDEETPEPDAQTKGRIRKGK